MNDIETRELCDKLSKFLKANPNKKWQPGNNIFMKSECAVGQILVYIENNSPFPYDHFMRNNGITMEMLNQQSADNHFSPPSQNRHDAHVR